MADGYVIAWQTNMHCAHLEISTRPLDGLRKAPPLLENLANHDTARSESTTIATDTQHEANKSHPADA